MIQRFKNIDLRPFNTFRLNAQAREMLIYDSPSDLPQIFKPGQNPDNWLHIGGGSNMLFCCDFCGTVLKSNIKDVTVTPIDNDIVLARFGSGVTLGDAVHLTVERGLWGIENLTGIPGEIGGAAVQNVGAYGVELADVLESVECFDTIDRQFLTIGVDHCGYGYRQSRFKGADKGRFIVTAVNLRLSKSPKPVLTYGPLKELNAENVTIGKVAETIAATRRAKLPEVTEVGSAGSFFKNPIVTIDFYNTLASECVIKPVGFETEIDGQPMVKLSAAWLIDKAGLKGMACGGASTWSSQPLVIVNTAGNATPADILELESKIIETVRNKFGVTLNPEVEHITNH